MRNRIILLILYLFITVSIGFSQTIVNQSIDNLTFDKLKQKYGSPDAQGRYIVRPDIGLLVKYKQDQNPSEINILPLALDIEDTSRSSDEVMPSDKAEEVLDELVPVAERGAKGFVANLSAGCPFSNYTEYERLTIIITKRCERRGGGTYSISVFWKEQYKA